MTVFQLRLAQFALETLGDIEGDHLLRWTIATIRAAIFAAVSGIYDHGVKSFARVFDRRSSNRAAGR